MRATGAVTEVQAAEGWFVRVQAVAEQQEQRECSRERSRTRSRTRSPERRGWAAERCRAGA
jgi:hypothetical protein